VFELRSRRSLHRIGLVLILSWLTSSAIPARGQQPAPPVRATPAPPPVPNTSVDSRWPLEESLPPTTAGRAPAAASVATPGAKPEAPASAGWSALLPKDSAPAAAATPAQGAKSPGHKVHRKSTRAPRAHVAKRKSPRADVATSGARSAAKVSRPATPHTRVAKSTGKWKARSAKAKSSTVKSAHAKSAPRAPHRPLALTPAAVRGARRS
jgi:hypothetical protein